MWDKLGEICNSQALISLYRPDAKFRSRVTDNAHCGSYNYDVHISCSSYNWLFQNCA